MALGDLVTASTAVKPGSASNSGDRNPKRARAEGTAFGGGDEALLSLIPQLESRLKILESVALNTFLLPSESSLGSKLMQAMASWNSKKPKSGGHPDGASRLSVGAALIDFIVKADPPMTQTTLAEQHATLRDFANGIKTLGELEFDVSYCMARETKKGNQVLLKFAWHSTSVLHQTMPMQFAVLSDSRASRQSGPAPKNHIIKNLEAASKGGA